MIYHITTQNAWEAAQEAGTYEPPSLADEGCIHCSTRAQIIPVAHSLYAGRTDLVLLLIDKEKLDASLKWEPPVHPNPNHPPPTASSQRFPHIYGPVNLDAVTSVIPLPPNPDGSFMLPKGV